MKLKIIVFTTAYHPFIGGAEIAVQEIAKRLNHKFDFFIITSRFRRDLPKKEIRPEGTIIRLGLGTRLDKWLLPILGFFRIIWNLEFGIWDFPKHNVIAFWGIDLSQGSLAAALLKIFYPNLFFVFNIQYGYGDHRLKKGRTGLIGLAFRFILSKADYVTAISNYLLDLVRVYGYEGKATLIPNGTDLEKFKAQSAKFKTTTKSSKVIITTSRLVPKNGVDILIRAITEVRKAIPDIRCRIIGDGPERYNLERLVLDLDLEQEVEFLGNVPYEKVPEYLAEADVFARPSRSEGMGNAFVEALAVGIPIIGTRVGGITDIIKEGETGLFCKEDDPSDLAKKIIVLLNNESFSRKIAENGRKMVEERFSWKTISGSYEKLFEEKLKKKILITTGLFPPDIGGPATYSKILFEELPKHGFDVRVLSFSQVRHLPKVFRHFTYFLRVCRCGRKSDIIFAQDPVSVGLPSALASVILRKNFVLKIVGDYAWEQGAQRFGVADLLDDFLFKKYGWKVEILRGIQKFVAERAEKIIVPSKYLKKVVSSRGITENKIHVIYNSFDPPSTSVSKEEARRKLGLSGTILVSAGRLVPWKGFETLVEIVPDVLRKIPDIKLVIIGEGPSRQSLEFKINNLGLGKAVCLMGAVSREEMMVHLKAADIFVLNTAYEGFSHTLLEAAASGLPIITTRVGGNQEIIQDGKNGLLVNYNYKRGLIEAILKMFTDERFRRNMILNGQERLKEFDKETMIKKTLEIINL